VSVTGLGHRYDKTAEHPILSDLHLTVASGETVALVGSSGSGKSTLLNLIGGLEPIQSGQVRVFDEDLHQADEAARTQLRRSTLGFIYQSFNLIPTLSVEDNVRLPLALAGVGRHEQQQRVSALLETVGLAHRQKAFPDALSGGEQQRVAIARAVVHRPPLLLADEPTGNLDAKTGQQVLTLMQSLVAEHNTTLLMVTHSHQVAQSADRVLAMIDGQLLAPDANQASNVW
jgi:putative ABC transport system ATP-binding protein